MSLSATPSAALYRDRRYVVETSLGKGGMGVVYKAYDRLTRMQVALKQVSGFDMDIDLALALALEFRTLSRLRHPHIVAVLDYGFDTRRHPYYTMQLIEPAQPLTAFAAALDVEGKVRLCLDILLALVYLHRHGIIHRDLKPQNILVAGDGGVKVVDFGLALSHESSSIEASEGIMGTLHYMAPELLADSPASVASDLYAVGVILYELLAGERPFNDPQFAVLIDQILSYPPDLARLPASLIPVVERLLDKDPAQRYHSAQDVIQDLCRAANLPLPGESAHLRESFLQASAFVGRQKELATLRAALQQVIRREGGFWLIAGEGGVGKSRLMDELRTLALVQGVLVLRGQEVMGGGLPYQAWREPVRRLCLHTALSDVEASVLKLLVPDIATLLERPVPDAPELDGALGQQRLILTVVDIFKRQTQPVLLLLEDLHWSAESLALLRQLYQLRDQLPHVLAIGTYRDDERPTLPEDFPGVSLLKLHRLDDEAVQRLAQSMLGEAGKHPRLVHLLRRETEGNAFFMVEIVRALAEEAGALSAIDVTTLPSSVYTGGIERIIQRRLDHMPDAFRPLLGRAAVAGRALDIRILQHGGEAATLDAFLTAGANASLFEISDGVWRFSHDKLREGVIAQLTPEGLAAQHRAVAEAIEAVYPGDAAYHEVLLTHWQGAGDVTRELDYLPGVVRRLIEVRADYERAAALIQRGLHLLPPNDARIAALFLLASTLHTRTAEIPQAKVWANQALDFARQHHLRAQIAESLFHLGRHERDSGNHRAAADFFQQSLSLYQEVGDLPGMADSLNGLGLIANVSGDYPLALDYYQQSRVAAQTAAYPAGIGRALNNLGHVTSIQGEFDRALAYFQQALDIMHAIGDRWRAASCLNNIAVMLLYLGKAAEARIPLEEAFAISQNIGDKRGVAVSLLNLGENAQAQGQDEAAEGYLSDCLRLFQELEDRVGVVLTRELLAASQLSRHPLSALPNLREGLSASLQLEATPRTLAFLLLWAHWLVLLGETRQAAELAGLVEAHPGTEAETRQKHLVSLKVALTSLMPADALESSLLRGAALPLEATAQTLLNQDWETLAAQRLSSSVS